jgi:hypothetical protein
MKVLTISHEKRCCREIGDSVWSVWQLNFSSPESVRCCYRTALFAQQTDLESTKKTVRFDWRMASPVSLARSIVSNADTRSPVFITSSCEIGNGNKTKI